MGYDSTALTDRPKLWASLSHTIKKALREREY